MRPKARFDSKQKNKADNSSPRPKLRFKDGDRVECHVSHGCWEKGIVVMLWYDTEISEDDGVWREGVPGRVVPYQILLDSGTLIFAPQDSDGYIRRALA